MSNTTEEQANRIISTVLNHIDIENKTSLKVDIPPENAEMESYLTSLLNELRNSPRKREYDFQRKTTEFYTSLTGFFQSRNLLLNPLAFSLAERLLSKEVDADRSYGHLGKKDSSQEGHIKRGSFLQFIYEENNEVFFLGVKVDHQSFLDENDFVQRFGLAINKKLYKACQVSFNVSGMPDKVFVYDTNAKPAHYWWSSFLELNQLRDDTYNTGEAINAVITTLGRIKSKYPNDYSILRNASVAAFKQQGEMKFDEFVQNTFASYVPEDIELQGEVLLDLCNRLSELPQKKRFDNNFTLDPAAVKFKTRTVKLNSDISLSITEGINNQNEKVWGEYTQSGKKYLVISVNEVPTEFVVKERVP